MSSNQGSAILTRPPLLATWILKCWDALGSRFVRGKSGDEKMPVPDGPCRNNAGGTARIGLLLGSCDIASDNPAKPDRVIPYSFPTSALSVSVFYAYWLWCSLRKLVST